MPETRYFAPLYSDHAPGFRAELFVRFTTDRRGNLVEYAVGLRVLVDGAWQTVRLYDNAHGAPEMHRYTLDGRKMASEPVLETNTQDGFEAAKRGIRARWVEMTELWRR